MQTVVTVLSVVDGEPPWPGEQTHAEGRQAKVRSEHDSGGKMRDPSDMGEKGHKT